MSATTTTVTTADPTAPRYRCGSDCGSITFRWGRQMPENWRLGAVTFAQYVNKPVQVFNSRPVLTGDGREAGRGWRFQARDGSFLGRMYVSARKGFVRFDKFRETDRWPRVSCSVPVPDPLDSREGIDAVRQAAETRRRRAVETPSRRHAACLPTRRATRTQVPAVSNVTPNKKGDFAMTNSLRRFAFRTLCAALFAALLLGAPLLGGGMSSARAATPTENNQAYYCPNEGAFLAFEWTKPMPYNGWLGETDGFTHKAVQAYDMKSYSGGLNWGFQAQDGSFVCRMYVSTNQNTISFVNCRGSWPLTSCFAL